MTDRNAGGPAAAGGMNFQAAVTSLAMVKLLDGGELNWLHGIATDVPVGVSSETGGAGDDIHLELFGGRRVEVQVKKGLRAGESLQSALIELAKGVAHNDIDFGVLAVSSTSSATVRETLARNIVRRGEGRLDGHCKNAKLFFEALCNSGYEVKDICRRIRIVTLHFEVGDSASLDNGLICLERVAKDRGNATGAWNAIYAAASYMIENRGRKDLPALLKVLSSNGIKLQDDRTSGPAAALVSYCSWVEKTNSTIPLFGMRRRARIEECWIDLDVHVRSPDDYCVQSLSEALKVYHSWGAKDSKGEKSTSDSKWLGRFYKKSILVAGPGMGKSCLTTMLAKRYAADKHPVFKVALKQVVQKMASGETFREAVVALGSDGSDLSVQDWDTIGFDNAVFLLDGLDECGSKRSQIAEAIVRFSEGLLGARIIVTTRPVGYDPSPFALWRHYDLIPPSTSNAQRNVHQILEAAEPNPISGDDWNSLTTREIETDFAKSIAGRSPLMITISAALLFNGHHLGGNNVQTYRNFFKLIDDIQTDRVDAAPVTPGTLRFVLNCLAWEIAVAPSSTTSSREQAIVPKIVAELDCTPLKAENALSQCMEYWQSKGLVETVQVGITESMTFVHKTFCEYAAARHLTEMEEEQRLHLIQKHLHNPDLREVMGFAAALGCATQIFASYKNSTATSTEKLKLLAYLLGAIVDGRAQLDDVDAVYVAEEAIGAICSNRGDLGFRVGGGLIKFAEQYSDEVRPYLQQLTNSDQIWTRLTGWNLVLAVGGDGVSLDDLKSEMLKVPNYSELRTFVSPFGGIQLYDDGQIEMFQKFVLAGMELLLSRLPAQDVDEFLPEILSAEGLNSVDFVEQATKVLKRFGRDYDIKNWQMDSTSLKSWARMFDPKTFRERQKKAFVGMFEGFPLTIDAPHPEIEKSEFLNLSALIELTDFWTETPGEFLSWARDHPEEPISEVWRLLLNLVEIDKYALAEEVAIFRNHLDRPYDNTFLGPFHMFERLDVPPPDYSEVRRLEPNARWLEQAVHHPVKWVKMVAVQALSEVLLENEQLCCAERLLNEGTGVTLWMGVWLAEDCNPDRAFSLVVERLKGPISSDCDYLYRTLVDLPQTNENDAFVALKAGLFSKHVQVAEAAGKYAVFLAKNTDLELETLLTEAFEHWIENEEPYPQSGGTVPPSPREDLLRALSIVTAVDGMYLVELFADPRSDVGKLAQDLALELVAKGVENNIVDAAIERKHLGFVKRLISSEITLTTQQVQSIGKFCSSESANGRLCSLMLVENGYCSTQLATPILDTLRADTLLTIRDRVKELDESRVDSLR